MPFTIGMFEPSHAHIGERLAALGLDATVSTFSSDGSFLVNGRRVPARDVSVDYVWLSTHINAGGFRDRAFEIMLECRSIGVLQTFNAGLDHSFYKKLSAKGTRICNSSAQGVAIAEYVFAQVMNLYHPLAEQRQLQADRTWKQTPFREISETNWLIVGFGPIGQEIAKRAKAFGATTRVVRRRVVPSAHADAVGTMADLSRFLPEADVIVLACPLNGETRGFADAAFFARLERRPLLVNIARGPLVDDAAMLAALDAGRIEAAVLDVFHEEPLAPEHPFWSHPKVQMTSHTSFFGSGGRTRWDRLFLDNIARFARGEALVHEVDPADIP